MDHKDPITGQAFSKKVAALFPEMTCTTIDYQNHHEFIGNLPKMVLVVEARVPNLNMGLTRKPELYSDSEPNVHDQPFVRVLCIRLGRI